MRRPWISIVALATVLAVGAGSATAYKPTTVEVGNLPLFLNGAFEPTKLPKRKPAPIHLALEGSELLAGPAPLKEAVFEIDRNVALDAKGLATCTVGKIVGPDHVPGACNPTQIGKGELDVEVAFPEQEPFIQKSHLVAFNAGAKGGVTTILIHAFLKSPVSESVFITAKVTKVRGSPYGSKWVFAIPVIAGGAGSAKKFQLELFRRFSYRQKRRSYLLGRCNDGKLRARWEAIFEDGTAVPGGFARPCTPKG